MEVKYKKLWPSSCDPSVGPIDGAIRPFVGNRLKSNIFLWPAVCNLSLNLEKVTKQLWQSLICKNMFDKVRLARVLYLPELSARTWVGQLKLNNSFTTCRSHPCQNDSSHHWIMVVTIYRVIFWGCPVQTLTVWIIYNGRQWLRQTFEQPIRHKYMFRMLRRNLQM